MLMTVILVAGLAAGLLSRPWSGRRYALAYRTQVAATGIIGLLCGWGFHMNAGWGRALAVILAAELLTFAVASYLFRRYAEAPLLSYGTYRNIGWWAVPMAAAFIGPGAALFAIIYDLVLSPRAVPAITYLRKRAPVQQGAGSAWIDYGAPVCVLVGFALQAYVGPIPALANQAITYLALASAGAAFCLLGASIPRRAPGRHHFKLASRSVGLSYLIMPSILCLAVIGGLRLPAASWLVAFAPGPFLLQSKAYGYCEQQTTAIVSTSLIAALALLPLALWLAKEPQSLPF